MIFLSPEIIATIPPLTRPAVSRPDSVTKDADAQHIVKLDAAWDDQTYYVVEYDPQSQVLLCQAEGSRNELVYLTVRELDEQEGPAKEKVTLDTRFVPRKLTTEARHV